MLIAAAALALLTMLTGCSPPIDDRVAEIAIEAADRQARQNQDVAELTRATATSHQQMIEVIEASRQDLLALEQDLAEQRSQLDSERHSLARERHRESILAPVLLSLGLAAIAVLPLGLAWQALRLSSAPHADDGPLAELLIEDIGSVAPVLLPREGSAPRLTEVASSALQAPDGNGTGRVG